MASDKLSPVVVAGLNRSKKLVRSGQASMVFVAHDADRPIIETMSALCEEFDVPLDASRSKRELRELCEIEVDCAVCAVLNH